MVVPQIATQGCGGLELPTESSGYAEGAFDKSELSNDVVLGYPADLTFAVDVHAVNIAREPG